MIDALDKIKPLLVFNSVDDFYYLQILQRKKENPQLGSNSRVIKNYYIKSPEYLEARYEEIKDLCNFFNARAMLRLNKRSFSKVAFRTIQNVANSMSNGEYEFIAKSYDRACGKCHNDENKTWIIDLDGIITDSYLCEVKTLINSSMPIGDKIIVELPTKNGMHLLTKPFDRRAFMLKYPSIDLHRDNPINLFIP